MTTEENLYICPVCFRICDTEMECHRHKTLECHPGNPGDERRKPLHDRFGNLVSRAPRWFLEAARRIPGWTPLERQ